MNLTVKEKETLSLLACEGPKTRYDLFKKTGIMSSSTAHKIIGRLKNEFIEVKREEPFRIREIVKKFYGLTFQGLIVALVQPENLKHMDQIARKHEELFPLLFGKWQHFKENGVEEIELTNVVKWLCQLALQKGAVSVEMVLQDFFIYVFNVTRPEERVRWLKAIHDDQDLKKEALIQERSFRIYSAAMEKAFRLIRQPKPNWKRACEVFKDINRMPMVDTEEEKKKFKKKFLKQFENHRSAR